MRDKMLIYSDLDDLNKKCKACNKKDHNIFNCPEIHYVPRKDFIIRRYLYSEPTLERRFERRRDFKRHNALKTVSVLQDKMFFFFDAVAARQEEMLNEEVSIEEFSESDLCDIPDSPMISAGLRRKASVDSGLLKVVPEKEEDSQKAREEEKERIVNFEGDYSNKKKDLIQPGMLSVMGSNPTVRRTSKLKGLKQMPSLKNCETTGSIKIANPQNQQLANMKSWDHDFERVHIFTQYFKKNNVDVVLKKLENMMLKKAARIQKLKHMKKRKTVIGSPLKSSRYHMSSFQKKTGGRTKIKEKNEVSDDNRSVIQSPHNELSISWNLEDK